MWLDHRGSSPGGGVSIRFKNFPRQPGDGLRAALTGRIPQ